MFSNNFVVSIHVNNKPLNERHGVVPIPFGSEYSIRLRNKHKTRRAMVKVFIDGEEVSGNGPIINANSHLDLQGWVDKQVKFRFVSIDSAEAVDFGKNDGNADGSKGVIEVQFFLEKEKPKAPEIQYIPTPYPVYIEPPYIPYRPRPWRWDGYYGGVLNSSAGYCSTKEGAIGSSMSAKSLSNNTKSFRTGSVNSTSACFSADQSLTCSLASAMPDFSELSDGCTVEGGASSQTWTPVPFDPEPTSTMIRVTLRGYNPAEQTAEEVVLVSKPKKNKQAPLAPLVSSEVDEDEARLLNVLEELQRQQEKQKRLAAIQAKIDELQKELQSA